MLHKSVRSVGINLSWRLPSLLMAVFLLFSFSTYAKYKIAVVGKTKNDSFYEQSYKGCKHFAKSFVDVECEYDGPDDFQDVRAQVIILNELLQSDIDGLLVSTTDSSHLVEGALKRFEAKGIPVITFDSDLLPEHSAYRMAYVGTNNFDFGRALGNYAKTLKKLPSQKICIQSGHSTTPNLNERIAGVRFALSGQSENKMTGQNGWIEHERCPLYSLGKRGMAVFQLEAMLKQEPSPVFLAVAGFAQFSPNYLTRIEPYRTAVQSGQKIIISADTEAVQLMALKLQLSTVNIGQKPFEMGRLGAELLYDFLAHGTKPLKSHYYLDFHYCRPKNAATCTVNY